MSQIAFFPSRVDADASSGPADALSRRAYTFETPFDNAMIDDLRRGGGLRMGIDHVALPYVTRVCEASRTALTRDLS